MNSIEQQIWGFTPEGEAVVRYTMTNAGGASVVLSNIGAGIIAVNVPDRNGKLAMIVLKATLGMAPIWVRLRGVSQTASAKGVLR